MPTKTIPLGSAGFDAQINAVVARKMGELAEMSHGAETGRLLRFEDRSPKDCAALLSLGLTEIGKYVGLHYLIGTPPQALEQLVIAAERKGQNPAVLIKSTLDNFLVSYITPETSERSASLWEQLDQLKGEVVSIRKNTAT